MDIVAAVILVVFAVIGAASAVRELSLRLFTSKKDVSVLLITPLTRRDDAEQTLRSVAARMRWGGLRRCAVCLDSELDAETRRICETVCKDCGFLRLMTKEELKSEIIE